MKELTSGGLLCRVSFHFVLHQIEAMRKKVSATDPAMCVSASEWDSITLEQFKQANLWTTG